MLKYSFTEPTKYYYDIISNNLVKLYMRENIALIDKKYSYNEYSIIVSNKEDLNNDIEINFDIYLAQAKENENNIRKNTKIDNLKTSLNNSDYQVIKCFENYMLNSVLPYDFSSLLSDRISWRDEINNIESDSLTIDTDLDQEKQKKITEMMACCQSIITNGIDFNEEHYRLNTTDQINLTSLYALAQKGMSVPYHSDGNVCRIFTSEEMITLVEKATQFIIYNTTYFNLLKHQILKMKSRDEIKAVFYGMELNEEYKQIINSILVKE